MDMRPGRREIMPLFHQDIWKYQLQAALLYWFVVPAAVIFSGLLLDRLCQFQALPASPWLTGTALLLLAAGFALIWLAIRVLARCGKGTPNPRRPPQSLVTGGVYRWCRHPMFFGYDLAALAVVLLFRSPAMLCASFPVFLIMQIRFLHKEERYLLRRYGEAFVNYKRSVPFLASFCSTGEPKR
jgi:protein-S-isoprenylcysteine O-methyltransferase Ste14